MYIRSRHTIAAYHHLFLSACVCLSLQHPLCASNFIISIPAWPWTGRVKTRPAINNSLPPCLQHTSKSALALSLSLSLCLPRAFSYPARCVARWQHSLIIISMSSSNMLSLCTAPVPQLLSRQRGSAGAAQCIIPDFVGAGLFLAALRTMATLLPACHRQQENTTCFASGNVTVKNGSELNRLSSLRVYLLVRRNLRNKNTQKKTTGESQARGEMQSRK